MNRLILCLLCSLALSPVAQAKSPDKAVNKGGNKSVSARPAMRIVALSPHAVEMLFAIGAGEQIVATTDYADFPEAAKAIPRIGGYYGIQIERVIELNPDLVVVWDTGNRSEDIEQLTKLGYRIYGSDPKTLEGIAEELEQLGRLTGHRQQAGEVAADYRQQLATLRRDNAAKPEIKVFYQLWSEPLMTVAQNSWIQQLLEVCHGNNVFKGSSSPYPQVSMENVLLSQPEVIIKTDEKGDGKRLDWSQWQEIPAVKMEQIYTLNADILHRATPRALEGVEAICKVLDKAREGQRL